MIGVYRRWRARVHAEYDARLQSLLQLYPEDPPVIVEALLSPMPTIAAVASESLSRAASERSMDAKIRTIVREELAVIASRSSDAFLSRALTQMKES